MVTYREWEVLSQDIEDSFLCYTVKSLLVIYFIYSSVYMLILNS